MELAEWAKEVSGMNGHQIVAVAVSLLALFWAGYWFGGWRNSIIRNDLDRSEKELSKEREAHTSDAAELADLRKAIHRPTSTGGDTDGDITEHFKGGGV